MNKKTLRKLEISLLAFLAAVAVTACGKPVKNEKEIAKELESSKEFFPYCDLKIQKLEIIKRQTDEKSKSDLVYARVYADSENAEDPEGTVSCELAYKLQYNLYNEGWILDEMEPYDQESWVISEPSPELLEADAKVLMPFYEKNELPMEMMNLEYRFSDFKKLGTEEGNDRIWCAADFQLEEKRENSLVRAKGTLGYQLTEKGWEYQEDSSKLKAFHNIPFQIPDEEEMIKGFMEDSVGMNEPDQWIVEYISSNLSSSNTVDVDAKYIEYYGWRRLENIYRKRFYFDSMDEKWMSMPAEKNGRKEYWNVQGWYKTEEPVVFDCLTEHYGFFLQNHQYSDIYLLLDWLDGSEIRGEIQYVRDYYIGAEGMIEFLNPNAGQLLRYPEPEIVTWPLNRDNCKIETKNNGHWKEVTVSNMYGISLTFEIHTDGIYKDGVKFLQTRENVYGEERKY